MEETTETTWVDSEPEPERTFVTTPPGESFANVDEHHCPEGFHKSCLFLLAWTPANLFERVSAAPQAGGPWRCKGCGEIVEKQNDFAAHQQGHRDAVSALRKAGKERSHKKTVIGGLSAEYDTPLGLAQDMRVQGASYQQVADEFARRGIKTKTGKEVWSTTQVMRLLKS